MVTAAQSGLRTTSSALAVRTEPQRIERSVFANELTPCLALVSASGMTREDRREWMEAAYRALSGFTPAQLKIGAAAAMRTADHPSKIVPAIISAIHGEMKEHERTRYLDGYGHPSLRETREGYCTPEEAAEIMAQLRARKPSFAAPVRQRPTFDPGPKLDPSRARMPTREDYLRMGVAPEVLDRIEAEAAQARAA